MIIIYFIWFNYLRALKKYYCSILHAECGALYLKIRGTHFFLFYCVHVYLPYESICGSWLDYLFVIRIPCAPFTVCLKSLTRKSWQIFSSFQGSSLHKLILHSFNSLIIVLLTTKKI